MDADEILARKLQAEEDAATAAETAASFAEQLQVRPRSSIQQEQASFISQIQGAIQKVNFYDDELSQAMALSVMDLEAMKTRAAEAAALSLLLEENPPLAEEDQLALELLSWFKLEFFSWVDKPCCLHCQNPATYLVQTATPTAEESAHLASRTEVYYCTMCGTKTRFPRYNDPVKLLETRKGRCGEWAIAFCLICRTAGLDTRLIIDFTDHIWVEYYSAAMKRWIHMDPCEAIADKPLLYEVGWGKKLTYLIAVGRDGVLDVSRRYTRQYNLLKNTRRGLDDVWISGYFSDISNKLRSQLDEKERIRLEERDRADVAEMMAASTIPLSKEELRSLPGRQTGSAEWVNSRGEGGGSSTGNAGDGGTTSTSSSTNPQQQPSTRYQWARDTPTLPTTTGEQVVNTTTENKICGGVVRASGENAPGETAIKAFDGKVNTKWLDFGGFKENTAWLEYRLLPTDEVTVLGKYALVCGDDAPERDPAHVVVEAWVEKEESEIEKEESKIEKKGEEQEGKPIDIKEQSGSKTSSRNVEGTWVVLDERTGLCFSRRGQRLEFSEFSKVPSRRWRLRVVKVLHPQQANSVQLACWDLYKKQ